MLQLLDEITARTPWREFDLLHRGLNEWLSRPYAMMNDIETLPVNVYVNDEDVKVLARIPGWSADWFDLSVEGNRLHIKGETKYEEGSEQKRRQLGRTINLPFRAQADKVEASYKDGILAIQLKKHEQDRPRKIKIQAA